MSRGEKPTSKRPLRAVGVFLLILAAALLIAFNLIGSYVDADGWLHEPFALIPMAWLCGLLGLVLTATAIWRGQRRGPRRGTRRRSGG